MKGARLAALALGVLAASAQAQVPAAASELTSYALDPTHTFVHWEVLHMNTSTIRGRFDRSSGAVQFDARAQRLDLSISIDTSSVNSGVRVLDTLLRGSEMLDTATSPMATFVAREARFEGEALREVLGEFTLRGIRQPLTLTALRWNCRLNLLFLREVCGGDFEAQIDRSDFGITHSALFVADRVRLLIQVEGIRQ